LDTPPIARPPGTPDRRQYRVGIRTVGICCKWVWIVEASTAADPLPFFYSVFKSSPVPVPKLDRILLNPQREYGVVMKARMNGEGDP
jgi:hypothetical protein